MFTTRPELRGTFGMVASTHWLASAAGMSVLDRGGNAFDAAVTAAWLKLIPAPEVTLPVAAFHRDTTSGCEAILRVLGHGIRATAIEYLDGETLACAAASFEPGVPEAAGFMVLAEADGSAEEAERMQAELVEALGEGALAIHAPRDREGQEALWRWRAGLAFAVLARRGAALSDDIVVPFDRLAEAIEETVEIGRRHDLIALSFGHAGDGNLHSTFLVSPESADELRRAERACEELFELAVRLGGSVSGEHGIGLLKRGQLARQWSSRALELHAAVKASFDPKNLLNPGKKHRHVDSRRERVEVRRLDRRGRPQPDRQARRHAVDDSR